MRVLEDESFHVALVDEEDDGVDVGRDRRRIRAAVEHRDLGDRRAGAFDVNDLLAPVDVLAKRAKLAFDDDVESRGFAAPDEQDLAAREPALDAPRSERDEGRFVEIPKKRGRAQLVDRRRLHAPILPRRIAGTHDRRTRDLGHIRLGGSVVT